MLKQSKTQLSLMIILGLMIVTHIGFVLYKKYQPLPEVPEQKVTTQCGSAKAFGLIAPKEKHFQVASVKELDSVFRDWDYDLKKAKSEGKVPRLYLSKLPKDMQRKARASNPTFIQTLLPHILEVNEQILRDRTRLIEMRDRQRAGGHLRQSEKMWLMKLAADYRCKSTKVDSLLMHVDVIPPSLALSQAMLETGGGRSHAAVHKNSVFGQMATLKKVQKFETLRHGVDAYMRNLNRHGAYSSFRKTRADLRAKNKEICGHKLASCLTKYSIRGTAYTQDLKRLIERFSLKSYDKMELDKQPMRLKPL
jgi:Bax protein